MNTEYESTATSRSVLGSRIQLPICVYNRNISEQLLCRSTLSFPGDIGVFLLFDQNFEPENEAETNEKMTKNWGWEAQK